MTPAQRVMAAITGDKADCRAFTLTLSLYGAALTGCPLGVYHADPARYLEGQLAVRDAVGPDILFSPFVLPLEGRAFGCTLAAQQTGPPNVKKPAFRSAGELLRHPPPRVDEDPGLAYLVESVRLMVQSLDGQTPVAGILTAPTDLAAMILGIEPWLEALLFDPDLARRILDITGAHFRAMSAAMMEAGAACIVVPIMFCNPRIINPELARTTVLPALREAFAGAPGPVVFHHGGNPLSAYLGLFADVPNVLGFVLDDRDSFAEARQALGPGHLLMGGLSGPHMSARNPEEIRRRVMQALDDRRDDARFILASSHADVPLDTPLENLLAVRDAVREHG